MSHTISPQDKQLLAELRHSFSLTPPPLCPDFYHTLVSLGYAEDHVIVDCFENLLLDEPEYIADVVHLNKRITPEQTLTLFDYFLSCFARKIAKVIDSPQRVRQSLEAMRRLSFAVLAEIQRSWKITVDTTTPKAPTSIEYSSFVQRCDSILEEKKAPVCIVALQLDFGSESILTVQEMVADIARELTSIMRENDFFTQVSIRRWIIALPSVSDPNVAILAATKIRKQFSSPIKSNKRSVLITPYIGIAISSASLRQGDALIEAASVASAIPVNDPLGYQLYSPELDAERKRLDVLSVKLKKALFDNELVLYYQPKYSISKQKIVGLESLLRWKLPEGYVDIPSIFNLIDREGLLDQFTTWLFQTAFRNLSEFLSVGIDIKMSINVLPKNLMQPEFPTVLDNMVNIWKVPKDRVVIEITEGSLLEDAGYIIDTLHKIRSMGFEISMDDFGTGYSSLSYLSRLPLDELKIDQAFVRNMFTSSKDGAIVRTIVEMGQNFGLKLVAEGVETPKDASYLSSLGCDIVQGYWISKPVDNKQIISWFNNDLKSQWNRLPLKL